MSRIFNNTKDLILKVQSEEDKQLSYIHPGQTSGDIDGFAAYIGSRPITSHYGVHGNHVWKVAGKGSFVIKLEIFKNLWNNYDIHDKSDQGGFDGLRRTGGNLVGKVVSGRNKGDDGGNWDQLFSY